MNIEKEVKLEKELEEAQRLYNDGKWQEAAELCERVYEAAIEQHDYLVAGHVKQIKADALRRMAKEEYVLSVGLYSTFEQRTGMSAARHIDGVADKIIALN